MTNEGSSALPCLQAVSHDAGDLKRQYLAINAVRDLQLFVTPRYQAQRPTCECLSLAHCPAVRTFLRIRPAMLRDAEIAKVPFLAALTGALRRYPWFMWPATLHSGRLALHPASTTIKRYLSYFRIP